MDYIRETVNVIRNYDNIEKSIENLQYKLEDNKYKLQGYKETVISDMPKGSGASEPDDGLCNLLYEQKVLEDNLRSTKKQYANINKLLNGLADDEKKLIVKAYCSEQTDTDIANDLNISRQALYTKKRKLIKKLAIQLWGINALQ